MGEIMSELWCVIKCPWCYYNCGTVRTIEKHMKNEHRDKLALRDGAICFEATYTFIGRTGLEIESRRKERYNKYL